MKLILHIDFNKVIMGRKVRNQVYKLFKKKKKKIEKKDNVEIIINKVGKKGIKVITIADTFENIDKMKSYWAEMFEGQAEKKTEKDLNMSLKDKAQLARGKMTNGVKKKAIWITGKLNVKYRYEVVE